MMYGKAILFQDLETASKILQVTEPSEHQRLGREVRGFDREVWAQNKEIIVQDGNYYKFSRREGGGEDLRKKLLETGEREMVEVCLEKGLVFA